MSRDVRPRISRLWLNKRVSRNFKFTSLSCAPQHSLGCLGCFYKTNYSLELCTTKSGIRATQPASDHCCAMSWIFMKTTCTNVRWPLKMIVFRQFQIVHKVRITKVCPFISPSSSAWLNDSSKSRSSLQPLGSRLSHELQEAASCHTDLARGHSKKSAPSLSSLHKEHRNNYFPIRVPASVQLSTTYFVVAARWGTCISVAPRSSKSKHDYLTEFGL